MVKHQPGHSPATKRLGVCQGGHGCTPIPPTAVMLRAIQNTDLRCPSIELPQEQIDALAAVAVIRAQPPDEP